MTCIVAYDISNTRLRGKLSRYLAKLGVRLQKSVFAIEIERHAFKRLMNDIHRIVGDDEAVAVFRLCEGCKKNARRLGEPDVGFYVF